MLNTKTIETQSDIFKLISDPTRLKIINLLLIRNKELCVSDISGSIDSSHSATSHQLAKLERADLVECSRKGQMMCYKLTSNKKILAIKKILQIIK